MSNGCSKVNATSTKIAKSVFRIGLQNNYGSADTCSGVLISPKYVLTAAHCVINRDTGVFNLNSIKIVTPTEEGDAFYAKSSPVINVKAVYIPYHYDYYGEELLLPYPSYRKQDFALLELQEDLKLTDYKPLDIAAPDLINQKNQAGIIAGYGLNDEGKIDYMLRYRSAYFWESSHGALQISDTLPTPYKGEDSAWSLSSFGDSGGPFLIHKDGKDYVAGVLTGGMYCSASPFFAKIPYALSQYASMLDVNNQKIINDIKKRTLSPNEVRCFALEDKACNHVPNNRAMYAISQDHNKVSSYMIKANGDLEYKQTRDTGAYPSQFILSQKYGPRQYIYTNNLLARSVSFFTTDASGGLSMDDPYMLSDREMTKNIQRYVAKNMREYLLTVSNTLRFLEIEPNSGGLYNKFSIDLGFNPDAVALIRKNGKSWFISAGKKDYLGSTENYLGTVQIIDNATDTINLELDTSYYHLFPKPDVVLQILPTYSNEDGMFYLLTDRGIYLYKMYINMFGKVDHITLIKTYTPAEVFQNGDPSFSKYTKLIPVSNHTLALSDGSRNIVLLNLSKDYAIHSVKKKQIDGPTIGLVKDKNYLYAALFYEGAIFRINLIKHGDYLAFGEETRVFPSVITHPYQLAIGAD
jgi:hypothetical protein